jgi:hypothetical protein
LITFVTAEGTSQSSQLAWGVVIVFVLLIIIAFLFERFDGGHK